MSLIYQGVSMDLVDDIYHALKTDGQTEGADLLAKIRSAADDSEENSDLMMAFAARPDLENFRSLAAAFGGSRQSQLELDFYIAFSQIATQICKMEDFPILD